MTQQMLFSQDAPRRRKKAVNVPRTSVLAYQEQPRDTRVQHVLEMLPDRSVTSAELAKMRYWTATTDDVLYIRRGLSDALALGLVEHAPARKCAVSGRTCLTWRVRTR